MINNPPLPPRIVAGRLGDMISALPFVKYPPYKAFCTWTSERPHSYRCTTDSHDAHDVFVVVVKNGKIIVVTNIGHQPK